MTTRTLPFSIAACAGLAAVVLAASGCMREPRYVITDPKQLDQLHEAWKKRGEFPPMDELDYHIPLYAKFLGGMKICLDPGHGGDAHMARYKRGPTDYREAIMNWKVANYLKNFLETAGADVMLTRDGDVDVSLRQRNRIANEWGADLFISIHHNAAGPMANRTTTWYHANPDYEPANLDVARYIQVGVAEALRLPSVDEMPLKTDYQMYEGSGFGVLRNLDMVGCLCEASFFTNPYEEYRLKQDWYLKREAYGYLLGLARYAWMGVPRGELLAPAAGGVIEDKRPAIRVKAHHGYAGRRAWGSDRTLVFSDSVTVKLDGRAIACDFDTSQGIITARLEEPLKAGEHTVVAGYRNHQGNYAHPVRHVFTVDPPLAELSLALQPGGEGQEDLPTTVTLTALDADGEPILDGSEFRLVSEEVEFSEATLKTKGGVARTSITRIEPAEADRPVVIRVEGKFGSAPIALQKPYVTPWVWRK